MDSDEILSPFSLCQNSIAQNTPRRDVKSDLAG
jgi:hypothetical protein